MAQESSVDEIKARLDIVEFVGEFVPLKRAGQNYKGLCPFHKEKTPSFMVSSPKQIFHCFGCGAGGDIFGFLMKFEGLSFPEAVELLAKRAGVELKDSGRGADRGIKDSLKTVTSAAEKYYRSALTKSQPAKAYLKKRGVSKEASERFALGYAPPGWHDLSDHLRKNGVSEDLIRKAGLTAQGQKGSYDIFRGRIMFPIFDMYGSVIAFGGRVMGDADSPKYLNSPDTPLFRKSRNLYGLVQAKDSIREQGHVLVTEGYFDVIASHQHGIENTVAPLGTALTEEHVRLLGRYAKTVLLVFDGDAAGVAAAKRSLGLVLAGGLDVKVLLMPEGQDPDSVLKARGSDGMREFLAGAHSPMDFMLRSAAGQPKVEVVREALGVIRTVRDAIVRDELVRELSGLSGTREAALREELARAKAPVSTGVKNRRSSESMAYNADTLLLSVALTFPEKAADIIERLEKSDIADPVVSMLLDRLGAAGNTESVATTDEEKALVARLVLKPGFEPEDADRVVEDCLRNIARMKVEEKIRQANSAGDLKLLSQLLTERQKLMQEAP